MERNGEPSFEESSVSWQSARMIEIETASDLKMSNYVQKLKKKSLRIAENKASNLEWCEDGRRLHSHFPGKTHLVPHKSGLCIHGDPIFFSHSLLPFFYPILLGSPFIILIRSSNWTNVWCTFCWNCISPKSWKEAEKGNLQPKRNWTNRYSW